MKKLHAISIISSILVILFSVGIIAQDEPAKVIEPGDKIPDGDHGKVLLKQGEHKIGTTVVAVKGNVELRRLNVQGGTFGIIDGMSIMNIKSDKGLILERGREGIMLVSMEKGSINGIPVENGIRMHTSFSETLAGETSKDAITKVREISYESRFEAHFRSVLAILLLVC